MCSVQDTEYDRLQPEEIRAALVSKGLGEFGLQYRPETQSTNADVLAYYQHQQRQTIAVCETQTAGRGRRGRAWQSPFAQNIYCTIGIEKQLPAAQLGLLSIVSGLALCDALSAFGIEGIKIKWPNDLYHQRCKLGGILIESRPVTDDTYFLAIGFGINVFMTQQQLAEIPQAATSLCQISTQNIDRQALLVLTVETIIRRIQAFNESAVADLVSSFQQVDAFDQQAITIINSDEQIQGVNAGITESGLLRLITKDGEQHYSAAEISLRAAD